MSLARTIRSNLHQEAAKIGCTGMGNQCKRGQCLARAMQVFPGNGMDRIPNEVVLALLGTDDGWELLSWK
ncbi:unnamed protein product [Pylaiella littoralis]